MTKFASKIAIGAVAGLSSAAIEAQQYEPPSSMAPISAYHPEPRANNFRSEYESRYKYSSPGKPQDALAHAQVIADCLAKRAKGGAGDLLGGTADDPNFEKLQKALAGKYSSCNTESSAGIPMLAINTALAEQILRSENRGFAAHVSPADIKAAKAFYASTQGVTMDSLGRCLAVYSPGMVQGVLGTAAGSANEIKAFEALYAETPECGVRKAPSGIPANEQRNAVANGLYYWTHRG